jgi:hypothetical protein
MFLTPITETELHEEIMKLHVNKSPGMDEIPPKLVKCTDPFIIKPLCHIFNLSFTQGLVPESLKIAKVIPIYKKKGKI